MKLHILADDLTGALDSAAVFAGEHPVYLDRPGERPGDDTAGVSVVATATRDVAAAELPALLEPVRAWLRDADIGFKKVDSLLRGNTVAECALLARGHTRLVFAPAFPAQGRLTLGGRGWLSQPGSTTPQPIGERPIAEAFAALGIAEAWVPDVRSDAELRAVAALSLQASSRGWLWCGSAGLAHAMAEVHARVPQPAPVVPTPRPLMLLSASRHPVLRRQWARLEAGLGPGELPARFDLSSAQALSNEEAAARLAERMDRLVANEAVPGTLIVIGGDTLRALCRASAATSLRASASPRAGWGRARLVGGRWDGVTCHSRSGAFGADDDLLDALATLAARPALSSSSGAPCPTPPAPARPPRTASGAP